MRTTVNLDREVVAMARSMATTQGISLGKAISILARSGVGAGLDDKLKESTGDERFPRFQVSETAPVFGTDEVRTALEDE